jgi:hypothetical protein
MDTATLKENFESQVKTVNEQISKLEEELTKAREYKLKLEGGLETLSLLEQDPAAEAPAEEIAE